MLSRKLSVIHERDYLAPISQISPTSRRLAVDSTFKEYSLKQNVFDPTKSSPPNDFMLKLQLRMAIYDNNEDKRVNE
jgi:hypothetical protein